MKAVVLCGGRGERLMPMTDRRPAALLRLCGKEILLFTLEMLEKAGFEEAVLAVGYGSEQVERLLDEKYSKALRRLLEQQCAMKQKFLPWNVTVSALTLLMRL